jgi:two-component system cell cycle response regulator DivK
MTKILVADDNPVSRELIVEALDGSYELIEASDGREAVDALRRNLPPLALVDIQMPLLDGLGVAREVREDPALCHIVLVALTAYAMQGDRERMLQGGFDAYITKPVHIAGLRTQIQSLLADHRVC